MSSCRMRTLHQYNRRLKMSAALTAARILRAYVIVIRLRCRPLEYPAPRDLSGGKMSSPAIPSQPTHLDPADLKVADLTCADSLSVLSAIERRWHDHAPRALDIYAY